MRCDVHRLITPVVQIAASRANTGVVPIYIQLVAVVGGHMDHERSRRRRQLESAPEMIHTVFKPGCAGDRNPPGAPGLGEKVRIRRSTSGEQCQECEQRFHPKDYWNSD